MDNERQNWTGILGFILAAVGSAVGLGNIWRFPFVTGDNGGGAFVLIFIACVAVIGIPGLIAEMKIGRRSNRGPVGAFASLAAEKMGGSTWIVFGFFAVVTGVVLLSYYSIVGGWTLGYLQMALAGSFEVGTPDAAAELFGDFVGDPWLLLLYHFLFMGICVGIVIGGISNGIEIAAKVLLPAFGVLLLGLLFYALTIEGAGRAIEYMFYPEWGELKFESFIAALGQAFFTLSLGMGAIIVYGSYLAEDDDIYPASLVVAVTDTTVALIAGVIMFSIIFTQGAEPNAGVGLAFEVMPMLFSQIPGGYWIGVAFFALLSFAAITSAISILEVATSYFIEEWELDRRAAVLGFGAIIFIAGLPSLLGFNYLDYVTFTIRGDELTILGLLDYFIVSFALPLGGLAGSLYAGWAVREEEWLDEIEHDALGETLIPVWLVFIRFFVPAAIALILLQELGVLSILGLVE